ncbi:MAG: hypothetical protein NTY46_09035 [Candidatus Sumerlaeota bacterium]|nr:hypothetical protein [Candidatus Sumerlaeota bacterium]
MNILPVGPEIDDDPDFDRYFADLRLWNFDIAYNAYYAFTMNDVTGRYADAYRRFTARAGAEGVPSCVQIQSTVAHLDDIPLTETQRYADNEYYLYEHFGGQGKKFHFASFGSRMWLDYLKRITTLYREFGFEWVVYEEPMIRTDIPGSSDPMAEAFRRAHPGMKYPTHQDECAGYLELQKFKRDTLIGFFAELLAHAKSLGFQKAGIMPWFFTPTLENTPVETWNTCCDTGRVIFLKDLDFIVVRMQPDNILAQVMIGADGELTPTLAYYECLAHNLGKPVIMVNKPTDEHRPEANREDPLIPPDYFRRYALAAAAAAPQGMSRHWYGANYGRDNEHMALMADVNDALRRLAPAAAETAFVYSYSGASHAQPRPWRETWRTWWSFAARMTEIERVPFLTFFAESLRECAGQHPETCVIVLSEYFPIPPDEIEFLREWVSADARRRLVYFGGRDGNRWSGASLFQEFALRPPEMTALFGYDPSKSVEIRAADPRQKLLFKGNAPHDEVLGKSRDIGASSLCLPVMSRDSKPEIMYESADENCPVITRLKYDGGGEAWFAGISLDGWQLDFPFRGFLRGLADAHSAGNDDAGVPLRVRCANAYVYANTTRNGYFIASNCTARPQRIVLEKPARIFDTRRGRMIEKCKSLKIAPLSFKLMRIVPPGTRVLDVRGAITLSSINERDHAARISGMYHSELEVVTTEAPARILVSGRPAAFGAKKTAKYHLVKISGLPREGEILLEF